MDSSNPFFMNSTPQLVAAVAMQVAIQAAQQAQNQRLKAKVRKRIAIRSGVSPVDSGRSGGAYVTKNPDGTYTNHNPDGTLVVYSLNADGSATVISIRAPQRVPVSRRIDASLEAVSTVAGVSATAMDTARYGDFVGSDLGEVFESASRHLGILGVVMGVYKIVESPGRATWQDYADVGVGIAALTIDGHYVAAAAAAYTLGEVAVDIINNK